MEKLSKYALATHKGDYGEFKGASPIKAGRKIFARICRLAKTDANIETIITIKNIETRKVYRYFCRRIKLAEPRILNFGVVKYRYELKKTQ